MPSIALPVSLRGQLLSGTRTVAFSPSSLFAAGEPGVWYDPSDLSTLFQDVAGTIPVTDPGQTPAQTVALMLDKSKGLALGAPFTASSWTNSGTAWDVFSSIGGTFTAEKTTAGGTDLAYSNTFPVVLGNWYEVTIDVSATTLSSYQVQLSATSNARSTTATFSGTGVKTALVQANVASGNFSLAVSTTSVGAISVSSISVRELAGNHATQSITASRPTYGVVPQGGRRNLLTYSEDQSNAIWVKERSSVSATTGGYLVTVAGVSFSLISQVVAGTSGVPVTFTVIAKAGSATCIRIGAQNGTAGFDLVNGTATAGGTISAVGDGFYKCTVSYTGTASQINYIYLTDVVGSVPPPAIGTSLTIKNTQLETGSTATAYQRVTTQYDVTEAGVPSCSYLAFDGVDDFMITGTITPGADKVTVAAGVRKLSDAASGTIVESSVNSAANAGAFRLRAPGNAGAPGYAFSSSGTTESTATVTTGFTAPITNILTGLGDIAGDISTLRIDGAQVAQSTTDQGTGNFLGYAAYIGRRAGASLPFNGQIYSLVTRFAATDLATVAELETWINAKTGAYL